MSTIKQMLMSNKNILCSIRKFFIRKPHYKVHVHLKWNSSATNLAMFAKEKQQLANHESVTEKLELSNEFYLGRSWLKFRYRV